MSGGKEDKCDYKSKQIELELKMVIDKVLAGLALTAFSPIMLVAAAGIKMSGKGPVFYKAKRMGKDRKPLTIYKFRTMRVGADKEGAITSIYDKRVFAWGKFLRDTKIDELPQLVNILQGNMSIVGPRPEDMDIVNKYYTEEEMRTLSVLPGLACPGSIYNYTHGDLYLKGDNTEEIYVKEFLHTKLLMDLYYLEHWSLGYDLHIILRTLRAIFMSVFSNKRLDYPLEYKKIFETEHGKTNGNKNDK